MTVLAAIDRDKQAPKILHTAHEIADGIDDTLMVLHVITQEQFDEIKEGPKMIGGEWDIPYMRNVQRDENYSLSDAEADAAAVAEGIIEDSFPDDTNIESRGAVGKPAQIILDTATELDANYIVMGGRKRTPIGKTLFGSISQSVLLNATCPVVTVMQDHSGD